MGKGRLATAWTPSAWQRGGFWLECLPVPKPIPYLTDVHSEHIRRRLLSTVSDTLHFYHNPLTSKIHVNSKGYRIAMRLYAPGTDIASGGMGVEAGA